MFKKILFPLFVTAGLMISGCTIPLCCPEAVLETSSTALLLDKDGVTPIVPATGITITSTNSWIAVAPAGWTVVPDHGDPGGPTLLAITHAANTGFTNVVGVIKFLAANGDAVNVTVTMQGVGTINDQAEFDAAIAALVAPGAYTLDLNGAFAPYFDLGAGIEVPGGIDLTINGNGAALNATQVPPTQAAVANGGKNPVIFITGGNVVLNDLTISTDGVSAPNPVDGITIMGGTLEVNNVTFDGIWNAGGLTGIQSGRCITAYGTSEITVTNCIFQNFNKNGIHMYDTSKATVSDSQFFGIAANNDIGQNGIVFMVDGGHTPTGTVTNCSFEDFECLLADDAIGVLIYDTLLSYTGAIDGGGNTYTNCNQTWYIGI